MSILRFHVGWGTQKYQSTMWELCLIEVKNMNISRVWVIRQVGRWIQQGALNTATCRCNCLSRKAVCAKVQVIRQASDEQAESKCWHILMLLFEVMQTYSLHNPEAWFSSNCILSDKLLLSEVSTVHNFILFFSDCSKTSRQVRTGISFTRMMILIYCTAHNISLNFLLHPDCAWIFLSCTCWSISILFFYCLGRW